MKYLLALLLVQYSCGISERSLSVRGHNFTSEASDAVANDTAGDDLEEPPMSDSDDIEVPDDQDPEDPGKIDEKLFSFTYAVSDYELHSQNFFLTPESYENKFKMIFETQLGSQSFKQDLIESRFESFTQGAQQKSHTESFTVDSQAVVDILLVIDNSISMRDQIDDVSRLLPALLSYIKKTDWSIAVTTTDKRDSSILGYVDSRDPNSAENFRKLVGQLITNGANTERGIYKALSALRAPQWLRESSDIAVLFVSDEDNCSDGRGCEAEPEQFIETLDSIRSRQEYSVYSLIRLPSDERGSCGRLSKVGYQYESLSRKTAGLSASICESDYSSVFKSISANIKKKVSNRFQLKHEATSAVVSVNNLRLDESDFSISANMLTLYLKLSTNDIVTVDYQSNDAPAKKVFDIKAHASEISEPRVFVDGVEKSISSYELRARQLIFSTAPRENARIEFRYKKGKLQSNFVLNTSKQIEQGIDVFINSQKTENYQFNSQSKVLTFNEAPESGAEIYVTWRERSRPQLSYRSSFPDSVDTSSLGVKINGRPVGFSYQNDLLTIREEDFEAGTYIVVSANKKDEQEKRFNLDFVPNLETLQVETERSSCGLSDFIYEPNYLRSSCTQYYENINISYLHLARERNRFKIEGVELADILEIYVYVDGVLLRDGYRLEGEWLKIDSSLESASFVGIEVIAYGQ